MKVLDDKLFAGHKEKISNIVERIKQFQKPGEIVYPTGVFQFYGVTITQDEDMNVGIDGDSKTQSHAETSISRN